MSHVRDMAQETAGYDGVGCDTVVTGATNSATTASQSAGQACIAQGPKSRPVRQTHPTPATRSTHRNDPEPPKCPPTCAGTDWPDQCPGRPKLRSKPSPQSQGSKRPTPGTIPDSPGNCTVN